MFQWTIRYGEFTVRDPFFGFPIGLHGTITIYNAAGTAVRWFDGKAAVLNVDGTFKATAIGSELTGHRLRVFDFDTRIVEREVVIASVSEQDAHRMTLALQDAGSQINGRSLSYQLPPGSLGREPQNSNAVLATLFKAIGIEMPESIAGSALGQTGRNNILLDESAINTIKQTRGIDGIPLDIRPPVQCFPGHTLIALPNGCSKRIDALNLGDTILTFDPQADGGRGALLSGVVTRTFENVTQEWLSITFQPGADDRNGGKTCRRPLVATPGHEMLTPEGGFARLDQMVVWTAQDTGTVTIVNHDASLSTGTVERITYSAATADMFEQAVMLANDNGKRICCA
jgi:hypothetical protein